MTFRPTLIAAALALVAGTALAQSQGVSKDTITIGSIQDLSGPLAGFGKQVRLGMMLRVDEANEQGGINGRKIDLKVEDSGYDPKKGEELYGRCMACHQQNGAGMPGAFPPLAESEWVNGPASRPIAILMHGLQGEITVKGVKYNSMMMAYGTGVPMSDDEIATVLTYVRSNFGNNASAVTAAEVATVRAATASRTTPMTEKDLQALP